MTFAEPPKLRAQPATAAEQAADAAEAAAAAAAREAAKKRPVPWGTFLRSAPVWAIIVAHFCFNWGYYTLLAWLPSYFDMALGE
jgi:ACS family sodium-dependent inorganic phosphate cotransporter